MKGWLPIILLLGNFILQAQEGKILVVDPSGKGDFVSIQAAINSLPDTAAAPRIIRIRKGTYREKLFITKHQLVLEGERREATIITQDIARDEWRCAHADDWGVATININGNDITLKNLTIANDYGFHYTEPRTVDCPNDSAHRQKLITRGGHQMALRSMKATRLAAFNCHFRAYAGDTVSPWNLQGGMFYFKDCHMEGGVDFYCPRGWAWAENCSFFANTGPASIWHDGSGNAAYATVLKNCRFDGFPGFQLGRYHKDAQFFLLGCSFSPNMADRDIYQVATANQVNWGRRVYYFNSHRTEGKDFAWHGDNLHQAAGAPQAAGITPDWLFGGQWKPHIQERN